MQEKGMLYMERLQEIEAQQTSFKSKYAQLRILVEQYCKWLTKDEKLQFSNLFSRLNYIADLKNLDASLTLRLNTFRIHANQISQGELIPDEQAYLQDIKSIALGIAALFDVDIPADLSKKFPKNESFESEKVLKERFIAQSRVMVYAKDETYIYVYEEDKAEREGIKVKYNLLGINEEFNSTVDSIWIGCQLNLIDITVKENNEYQPQLIILEPDYLLDISSLAECMKDYGANPLNYLKSKFEENQNTKHMLLGNAANAFLDEIVNEQEDAPVSYSDAMRTVFKNAPFEFSTCKDLNSKEHEHLFFEDTKIQFKNIKRVVSEQFKSKHIDPEFGILEPSFMCEPLGIQGRLDYLQLESDSGHQIVIELKSGKAPFPEHNHSLISYNHESQAFLYQILIQKVLGLSFSKLKTYIFYSKYENPQANLRVSNPYMAAIRKILNIRNGIVANEHKIATATDSHVIQDILHQIEPQQLIQNSSLNPSFLNRFIVPQLEEFSLPFTQNNPLTLTYFYAFYAFVAREHYMAKAGIEAGEQQRSVASLWQSSLEQKLDAGEIFIDLRVIDNQTASQASYIRLSIPAYEREYLPNFRSGDIVILYERNNPYDSVKNKQIFKGSIQEITPEEIIVKFRYRQRNPKVIPSDSLYAIEHDYLDSAYAAMYKSLYAFLKATPDRKKLLLNNRHAEVDLSRQLSKNYISAEIDELVLKAKQAKDYFLIVGPPGTGKTSIALKAMVEEFMQEPGHQILLLSYTNRAVDEICEALDTVAGSPDYIRVGSELSCEVKHRKRLLNNVIKDLSSRTQVKEVIQKHRIFVGTVASLSGKTALFNLKHFHTAIVDEASQILEPNLLGILSAKNTLGNNAVDRFILIGDTKQLPAVVLQSEEASKIKEEALLAIGITDARQSLFERLYLQVKKNKQTQSWGILRRHGRMHPAIAAFPNIAFYNNELLEVPTSHQAEELVYRKIVSGNYFQEIIAHKRLAFIPCKGTELAGTQLKSNYAEAQIVSQMAQAIYSLYMQNEMTFSEEDTLGIITPYRSQIALIKKEIHRLGIAPLNHISVDTVERFQGSQRDIIIYCFCVNQPFQLDMLGSTIEEDGQRIDRKLNVALTRAKKQLFLIGNPDLLARNEIYHKLIQFIKARQGYMEKEEIY